MYRLAKLGFTQSYTYFAWRNTKDELTEYFTELDAGPGANFSARTVAEHARHPDRVSADRRPAGFHDAPGAGRHAGANYGIYGPAFELMEHAPREPGSEEYLDSEKYEIRNWDLDRPDSLAAFIARVNRDSPRQPGAANATGVCASSPIDNEQLICYCKVTDDLANVILVVVNLDPHHTQSGWVDLHAGRARHRSGDRLTRCTIC